MQRRVEANARDSPLLRLPPELRNQIYANIFRNILVPIWQHKKIPGAAFALFTCRQLRYETSALLYTQATFDFRGYEGYSFILGIPARVTGAQICNEITAIKLCSHTIIEIAIGRNTYLLRGLDFDHTRVLPKLRNVYVKGARVGDLEMRLAGEIFGDGVRIVAER